MKKIFTLLFSLFILSTGFAQTSPPLIMMVDTEEITGTDEVLCHLKVANFVDMGGYQFTIRWNPAEMSYLNIENFGPIEMANEPGNFNQTDFESGFMRTLWHTAIHDTRCLDLDDETVVLTLRFRRISGMSKFYITDDPLIIEVFDCNYNYLDLIFIDNFGGTTYVNQGVVLHTEDLVAEQISIYPNPAKDQIFFNWNNISEIPDRASIYDLQGKLISHQVIRGQTIQLEDSIIPGTYLLLLHHGSQFLGTKKLLIQN